ncbi:cytochrome bd-I ubiquinol oxidase subunit 1 apoprotein [Sediminihabitans luteus]|uniref:Cytochrome bd-I ubiquinol oxidase subunit 1 apoprotein n=1 Tax=Sediminihabitans luteus TaxID=1138585 RepID=A0A2M9CPK3_9CELL|nr:cytochrome ubiquinol oxidase subunit I [Sediminihabitans luteus]PJJ73824.1 cytochrome bd-I ubiquinol oxidase subunit 1 apoprotein [Sediminihabitans luteus]GIJ00501.1 putative integral membrane cytochrome D ubiquinol oxidase (Subunit I) CydA [Sediminihabitans luteus]
MDALDLARWQFGITTVYHFIFVPLTIGLAPLVAIMQTAWVRTGNERWLRLTKFFGKLLLINFAIGVATGIVQEFQFGMNWSEYSRFVGDVFGAPLAMEALAAFFVESTFLGLWIFGWDKLSKKVHLACIWAVAVSVNLSAFFILAANSWMQHPVGTEYNAEKGRAELVDIWAVLTNNTLLAAFPHTVTAAYLTAGTFVTAICAWWMVRLVRTRRPENVELARDVYRPGLVLGVIAMLVAGIGVGISGDVQGKIMYQQQPGKMSSAESLCEGEEGAGFSLLTIGDLTNSCEGVSHELKIPYLASYLGTGHFTGPESYLPGVNDVQEDFTERYGDVDANGDPVEYTPNLFVAYWSFRLMIGLAVFSAALALTALWVTRKGRVTDARWFSRLALVAIPMPFLAASFGWIFTEMGRQPWVVAPNPTGIDEIRLLTERGVSTAVSPGMVLASMILFTLLYAVLAVIWFRLMHRYAVEGVPAVVHDESPEARDDDDADRPLSFAY